MTHLKVAVRIRPLSHREIEENSVPIISIENDRTVAITNLKVPEQNAGDSRERIRRFTFDFCFQENSTQDDVFKDVENIIGNAIKRRYHSCVLAYGQSSSGKTYTMMGSPHNPGLTPRLCEKIFSYLQGTAVGDEMIEMKTFVSYLEIYNEKVRDLLSDGGKTLKIREHPKKGPYVQGLSEHPVDNFCSLLQLLHTGNNNRRVAATLNNLHSSRSHSVFIVTCCGVKLSLVDLAGSEKAGNRYYGTSRFREGSNINKSLVALGNVISVLAEQSKVIKRKFVPYRDSVLTWLLKDTLGGNSKTVMIATISPSSTCYSETVNTLRFGQRAKLIISTPVINEDPREKIIRELREEISKLRQLLSFPKGNLQLETEIFTQDTMEETAENDSILEPFIPQNEEIISKDEDSTSTNTNEKQSVIPKKPPLIKNLKLKQKSESFGSEESSSKSNQSSRKPSIDRLRTSFRSVLQQNKKSFDNNKKLEKATTTTDAKNFQKVEAKVNSHRKGSVITKPRSQIVAAVTNRLYVKTKKKEIATDTDDLPKPNEPPKELTICSNARLKLKELTKQMMKAHKFKNQDTQTDLCSVLRVKEIATDISDLPLNLDERRSVHVNTDMIEMKHQESECKLLETFGNDGKHNTFLITRTCGTQCMPNRENQSSNISFTKYLKNTSEPKVEISHSNPIYTSAVNINISTTNSFEEDSLEEQNLCFSTPDLISNHNSLEPHINETKEKQLNYADCCFNEDVFSVVISEFIENDAKNFASCSVIVPQCNEKLKITIPFSLCVAEICFTHPTDHCYNMKIIHPSPIVKPKIIQENVYYDDCLKISKPLVLKSIMKNDPDDEKISQTTSTNTSSSDPVLEDAKKVHFTQQNDRIIRVVSEFLEEATSLMSNLKSVASRIGPFEDIDLAVTINELHSGCKKKKRRKIDANCQTDNQTCSEGTQTSSSKAQFDFDVIYTNKYEALLEDSCRRLEEKINQSKRPSFYERYHSLPYNPWDLSNNTNENEDTSLESNGLSHSDYGSLPRRFKRTNCSPSAFLRHLTNLRRQVVKTSRDELQNT